MSYFINDRVRELLGNLSGFWVWRRQTLIKQLDVELQGIDKNCKQTFENKNNTIEIIERKLACSESNIRELKTEADRFDSRLEMKERELEELEKKYSVQNEKYTLVQNLISANRTPSEALENFRKILHEEYMVFANEESSLAEEAEVILHLQGVEQELEMISSFPALYGKSQIAISGGFSAGKTEFLNSLILNENVRLPTGIETVTSIPTYLTCDTKTDIYGYSSSGGRVRLEGESLKLISHEYVKSFGFEIRKLMPFLSVSVQLDPERFSNICFIDTPGYDPASATITSEHDREVAKRFAESAQALLWVMGADSGQISQSDIDFIESLSNFSKIPVYVVISKSEQRKDEIDDILDLVDLTFETTSINYLGVSAEDSIFRGKYGFRRMMLDTFFTLYDRTSHVEKNLCDNIDAVFNRYIGAIESDISKYRAIKGSLRSIDLDVFSEGNMTLSGKVSDHVDEMSSNFQLAELEEQIEKAMEIDKKLKAAVRDIFSVIESKEIEVDHRQTRSAIT